MKISYQTCLISIIFCIELLKGSSANCHGKKLKYIYGDALRDGENCMGPDGFSYPSTQIRRFLRKNARTGRTFSNFGRFVQDPSITRDQLLETYTRSKSGDFMTLSRTKRNANETSESKKEVCGASTPPRLCKSTFNTTAPMYGVSLTSGEAVTIVQKFPDLLQQVVYETCE
uniref:Putative LOC100742230 [Bombus impatiens] n=1 Tax=Lepeophtheirus salmonis TaxID=72036 RepID=A0A0K2TCY3_LEPSM